MVDPGSGTGDAPLLELIDVTKHYPGPPEVAALRGVSMRIRPGELTAIVGPSGSGKSTVLNLLGLLDEPTSGQRFLGGVATAGRPERERTALRATALGFVFQAFHLISYLDCVHNVMLPLVHQGWPRSDRRAVAIRALETVGLGHRLHARPATLSGGEQQRVAIARALVHEPAVLLCDEPTGNLDAANSAVVFALLRRLAAGDRAVVVVTHDAAIEDQADRVLRVADGRVG